MGELERILAVGAAAAGVAIVGAIADLGPIMAVGIAAALATLVPVLAQWINGKVWALIETTPDGETIASKHATWAEADKAAAGRPGYRVADVGDRRVGDIVGKPIAGWPS